jgi:transposase
MFKHQGYGCATKFRQRSSGKGLNFSPPLCTLHHDNVPTHKVHSVKQFLAQKWITEMEHPPYSPDLAPNGFWLFPNI